MGLTPEKSVENAVFGMCLELKIDVQIYDSKGQYSAKAKAYTSNLGMSNGTPDLIGCDQYGHFVAIELKAHGKGHLCSLDQYNFLRKKILSNGFAAVISCEQKLKSIYLTWLSLSVPERREFLASHLPKKVEVKVSKTKKIIVPISF